MEDNCKTVALVECRDYNRDRVYKAVKRSIELIGGIGKYVSPNQKVFLKFNMLQEATPEKCVTTHPEVVYAVAHILKEHGCHVVMGDSPGSGSLEKTLRKSYAVCGFDKIANELDISLSYDTGFKDVSAPASSTMKRFHIINAALEADTIVVVSKAKTHTLTYMTGAAKNMFGVIPGMEKPAYHGKFQSSDEFTRMIIDLNDLMKPRLHIMDAVMAMEGDGPHTGDPREIGAILASSDYNALDVVEAKLMDINPLDVGTIKVAIGRGYLKEDLSDVTVTGEPVNKLVVKDFKKPSTYTGSHKGGVRYGRFLRLGSSVLNECMLRPRINVNKCIGCMKCERSCPTKAVTMVNKRAHVNHRKCIKCYCCHEMCSEHAIALERSFAGKVLLRLIE